jgi:tetratricopeptide (TPR) repeat protein
MKRIAAAFAAFTVASTLAGAASGGVVVLGSTHAHRCMDYAFSGSGQRSAVDVCTLALSEENLTDRNRAGTLVNRGIVHMNRRDYAAAHLDFEAAVALRPDLGEAHFNRGSNKIAQGAYAEGVTDIERGLALGLKEPEKAYYNRALARESLSDVKGAYLDYRQAATLNPKWALPKKELARFTVTRR